VNLIATARKYRTALSHVKSAFSNHGARIALDELANQFKVWEWEAGSIKFTNGSLTSISDGTEYVDICRNAFLFENVYKKYKSCAQYREILEHCTYELGQEYLTMISGNKRILDNLKLITPTDMGSPFLYSYHGLGKASPTQIRYAKVLQDLLLLFGPLDSLIISEIGVGFGGQAIQIMSMHSGITYRLFDLEWPSLLSRKNIALAPQGRENTALISDWNSDVKSDLLISNYAFSELNRETQELYMCNIIANAKMGYVIFNHLHDSQSDSLTADEFASRIPGSQILDEVPLTFPGNVLVVWGHKMDAFLGEDIQLKALS
jgi:hypothetical protein